MPGSWPFKTDGPATVKLLYFICLAVIAGKGNVAPTAYGLKVIKKKHSNLQIVENTAKEENVETILLK